MSVTAPPRATSRDWWSLVALSLVTALVWVTASDISIALPAIGSDLGGSMDVLQWAVNGYFLAGALIIVGGRVGDLFGRRLIFLAGTGLILVGSVVAGLSPSPLVLIIGRVIEGIGAAAVLPTALAIIVVTFHGKQRQTAIAAWIAVCWGAQAFGPLVGGLIVDSLNWRWIFWVNLPIGLVAAWLVLRFTNESRDENTPKRIDIPGVVTLVGGIFLISYGLVEIDTAGLLGVLWYFIAAIVLLVAFVLIERKTKVPVVVLSIFKKGRFNGAILANLIANFVFGGAIFFLSLYLQVVEGYDALMAGALLLPATIPILILNPLGTWMGERLRPAIPITIGMIAIAISAYLMTDLSGSYTDLIAPFILLGVGIGLQITPVAAAAVEDPGEAGEGVASGIFKASSMIGGSLGVAVGTAVFQSGARADIAERLSSIAPSSEQIGEVLSVLTGGIPLSALSSFLPDGAQELITAVFDDAIAAAMWPSIVVSLIGALLAILLLRGKSPDASSPKPESANAEEAP